MKSYITTPGLSLLQTSLGKLNTPPIVKFTGLQVGRDSGFIPKDTMPTAKSIVLDRGNDPASVNYTPVHYHELILTAVLDRQFEFTVGNILFFANNIPFIWLVSETPITKLKIDPIAHFAGDKCYLSLVFRFPYIQKIIDYSTATLLNAKWPTLSTIESLKQAPHTLANQAFIEQNTLPLGRNNPTIISRQNDQWIGTPIMNNIKDAKFLKLNGGSTKAGI